MSANVAPKGSNAGGCRTQGMGAETQALRQLYARLLQNGILSNGSTSAELRLVAMSLLSFQYLIQNTRRMNGRQILSLVAANILLLLVQRNKPSPQAPSVQSAQPDGPGDSDEQKPLDTRVRLLSFVASLALLGMHTPPGPRAPRDAAVPYAPDGETNRLLASLRAERARFSRLLKSHIRLAIAGMPCRHSKDTPCATRDSRGRGSGQMLCYLPDETESGCESVVVPISTISTTLFLLEHVESFTTITRRHLGLGNNGHPDTTMHPSWHAPSDINGNAAGDQNTSAVQRRPARNPHGVLFHLQGICDATAARADELGVELTITLPAPPFHAKQIISAAYPETAGAEEMLLHGTWLLKDEFVQATKHLSLECICILLEHYLQPGDVLCLTPHFATTSDGAAGAAAGQHDASLAIYIICHRKKHAVSAGGGRSMVRFTNNQSYTMDSGLDARKDWCSFELEEVYELCNSLYSDRVKLESRWSATDKQQDILPTREFGGHLSDGSVAPASALDAFRRSELATSDDWIVLRLSIGAGSLAPRLPSLLERQLKEMPRSEINSYLMHETPVDFVPSMSEFCTMLRGARIVIRKPGGGSLSPQQHSRLVPTARDNGAMANAPPAQADGTTARPSLLALDSDDTKLIRYLDAYLTTRAGCQVERLAVGFGTQMPATPGQSKHPVAQRPPAFVLIDDDIDAMKAEFETLRGTLTFSTSSSISMRGGGPPSDNTGNHPFTSNDSPLAGEGYAVSPRSEGRGSLSVRRRKGLQTATIGIVVFVPVSALELYTSCLRAMLAVPHPLPPPIVKIVPKPVSERRLLGSLQLAWDTRQLELRLNSTKRQQQQGFGVTGLSGFYQGHRKHDMMSAGGSGYVTSPLTAADPAADDGKGGSTLSTPHSTHSEGLYRNLHTVSGSPKSTDLSFGGNMDDSAAKGMAAFPTTTESNTIVNAASSLAHMSASSAAATKSILTPSTYVPDTISDGVHYIPGVSMHHPSPLHPPHISLSREPSLGHETGISPNVGGPLMQEAENAASIAIDTASGGRSYSPEYSHSAKTPPSPLIEVDPALAKSLRFTSSSKHRAPPSIKLDDAVYHTKQEDDELAPPNTTTPPLPRRPGKGSRESRRISSPASLMQSPERLSTYSTVNSDALSTFSENSVSMVSLDKEVPAELADGGAHESDTGLGSGGYGYAYDNPLAVLPPLPPKRSESSLELQRRSGEHSEERGGHTRTHSRLRDKIPLLNRARQMARSKFLGIHDQGAELQISKQATTDSSAIGSVSTRLEPFASAEMLEMSPPSRSDPIPTISGGVSRSNRRLKDVHRNTTIHSLQGLDSAAADVAAVLRGPDGHQPPHSDIVLQRQQLNLDKPLPVPPTEHLNTKDGVTSSEDTARPVQKPVLDESDNALTGDGDTSKSNTVPGKGDSEQEPSSNRSSTQASKPSTTAAQDRKAKLRARLQKASKKMAEAQKLDAMKATGELADSDGKVEVDNPDTSSVVSTQSGGRTKDTKPRKRMNRQRSGSVQVSRGKDKRQSGSSGNQTAFNSELVLLAQKLRPPPIRVLLVEDNIINRNIMERFMMHLDVSYDVAANGEEAIAMWTRAAEESRMDESGTAIAGRGPYHIVFMDIQMPLMDGVEATKRIRSLERQKKVGVWISTGSMASMAADSMPPVSAVMPLARKLTVESRMALTSVGTPPVVLGHEGSFQRTIRWTPLHSRERSSALRNSEYIQAKCMASSAYSGSSVASSYQKPSLAARRNRSFVGGFKRSPHSSVEQHNDDGAKNLAVTVSLEKSGAEQQQQGDALLSPDALGVESPGQVAMYPETLKRGLSIGSGHSNRSTAAAAVSQQSVSRKSSLRIRGIPQTLQLPLEKTMEHSSTGVSPGKQPASSPLPSTAIKAPVIIVALTASSSEVDRNAALAAGCNDFLTKPVGLEWLSKKIIEWGCMQALIDHDGWRKWWSTQTVAKRTKTGGSGTAQRPESGIGRSVV